MNQQARWILPEPLDAVAVDAVVRRLQCAPPFAELLLRRGLASPDAVWQYLRPQLKTLGDPFLLPQMEAAVARLLMAIDAGENIVLYGDYDVDGVTSLAILTRVLRALGANVASFLPHRMEEGYGLTREGLARCLGEEKPRLLVAVDCGTTSVEEIAELKACGVDVIVLDHHECKTLLPDCVAVVNPKRSDAAVDYTYLCSAGLAFKLSHALLKRRPVEGFVLKEILDLVALGTVSDIVPLVGENRILVKAGLKQMESTRWVGLQALMEVARSRFPLTPSELGFQLGPRLNASGRLGTAQVALELLLTENAGRARALAMELDVQNRDRQRVEKQTHEEAEAQLQMHGDPLAHAAIVVGAPEWHPGVLGIVASRLARKYHRPSLVVGFDEQGVGKGSGRGIEGISLVAALDECKALLTRHGGHEMAAGLTVQQGCFEAFRERFLQVARQMLSDEALLPQVTIDAEMALADVTHDFLHWHEQLQPFGTGNAQPLFMARGVRPLAPPTVMKEKHLKLLLGQSGARVEAVFFNALPDELPRPPWDVAFRIERNEWRDRVTVQLQIQRIRTAE